MKKPIIEVAWKDKTGITGGDNVYYAPDTISRGCVDGLEVTEVRYLDTAGIWHNTESK